MSSEPSSSELFATLEREGSLVDRVAHQIESLIVSGKLPPGQPIPPEARLARLLGVSRTVIREALSRLQARHLLAPGEGGLLASAPTAESVGRSMALMLRLRQEQPDHAHVLEVRRMLEGEIAELAAARRTEADLQLLDDILTASAFAHGEPERFAALDVEFHRSLALATRNELFVLLLDALVDTLMTFRRIALRDEGATERALRYHRAVYAQVRAGDASGARAAMLDHMLEAQQTVEEAMVRLQTGAPGAVSDASTTKGTT